MPIHPINSANITFGRKKREQTKSQIIHGAIVGAAAGAGFSHFNKVKLDKGNIEESIKIIETKIPKTLEQSDSFDIIKKTFTSLKEHRDSQLSKMGIGEGTKEVSTQSILNGIVDNKEEKTVAKTILNIKKELSPMFFQTHKSCLVNLDNIKYINFAKFTIYFKNGDSTNLLSHEARKELRKLV